MRERGWSGKQKAGKHPGLCIAMRRLERFQAKGAGARQETHQNKKPEPGSD
jgi:hypothetical protein